MVTQDLLKNLFRYDNGNLIRVIKVSNNANIGDVAGCKDNTGYIRIKIDRKLYNAHRLVFLYHHGYLPKYIDHINGDRANNKINNLRPATISQNQQNRKIGKTNKSGVKGVHYHKPSGKWVASLYINSKKTNLGSFVEIKDAESCVVKVRADLYGEFANHG